MKAYSLFLALLFAASGLQAQTNVPVKLALISETDEASPAADLLTAKLSGNGKIQLLERDQIKKVYQEQGLSAANKDYLKLGRILGADGLLLLDIVETPHATNLMARLIAIQPGVILADANFEWPLKDQDQWTESAAKYLDSFLPKLTVFQKDAIPISVVNLRSAISSADAAETERQLKLLTIQRLSAEPQFFVLERQKMQLLGDEKELKADDSAFWDGSYLLEGTVDQNGYSPDTVTINARLTPPKGGQPILLEVSGSRTNLAEAVNDLAVKIDAALKVNSIVPAWSAADEAANYFAEANWALRWGAFSEAEAAADSAWALGKHDTECATMRVKTYLADLNEHIEVFQKGSDTFDALGGYDSHGKPLGGYPDEREIQADVSGLKRDHPWGLQFKEAVDEVQKAKTINYEFLPSPTDAKNITRAILALEIYYDFCRSCTNNELTFLSVEAGRHEWHNYDWYNLGIDDLTAASKVLQNFNLVPVSQKPVAEPLATLRALTRTVAAFISQSPAVHDSYFVGDRLVGSDELYNTIESPPNVFKCELDWGCFWKETPEDEIELYRKLMESPVFCGIQEELWNRELAQPRLAAWNKEDQKRVPAVWESFINNLETSTNLVLQLEATAMNRADAEGGELSQKDEEELKSLIDAKLVFVKQRNYLANFTPYNMPDFVQLFSDHDYAPAQVAELLPLIDAYKSNLVARANSPSDKFMANSSVQFIEVFYENQITKILNPPAPAPNSAPAKTAPITYITEPPAAVPPPEVVTNVITVDQFLTIPLDGLARLNNLQKIDNSRLTILAHNWAEGKLLLNFEYSLVDNQYGGADGTAMATLDPATQEWKVIGCPKVDIMSKSQFSRRSTFLNGDLFYCDGGKIERANFASQTWDVLTISDGNNYELYAVNGHLYAANQSLIFEIIDGGQGTRILASSRRQPPVTDLDSQMDGAPTLFEGPNHSLRLSTHSKIFSWTGSDWRLDGPAPSTESMPLISPNGIQLENGPELFADGVLFRKGGIMDGSYQNGVLVERASHIFGSLLSQDQISGLTKDGSAAELYLKGDYDDWRQRSMARGASEEQTPKGLWKMPPNLLPGLPAALRQSDLYFLQNAFAMHAFINNQHQVLQENPIPGDECNAALLCFSPGLPAPQKVDLKFEPAGETSPEWIFPTTNWLICGNSRGVWLMPLAPLDSAIAGQKQTALAQKSQAEAAGKQAQQSLMAKYDLNHNGVMDPDEREAALEDPDFIESQLDVIDANHNGFLDLEELAYFDVTHNKVLNPKEQTGIEIAQRLLAKRDLQKYDTNGEGDLNFQEFRSLLQAGSESDFLLRSGYQRVDQNHDGKIELNELQDCMDQILRQKLRAPGVNRLALMNQIQGGGSPAEIARKMFKLEVEAYWKDPGSVTNRAAIHGQRPFNPVFMPGGMPPMPRPPQSPNQ